MTAQAAMPAWKRVLTVLALGGCGAVVGAAMARSVPHFDALPGRLDVSSQWTHFAHLSVNQIVHLRASLRLQSTASRAAG